MYDAAMVEGSDGKPTLDPMIPGNQMFLLDTDLGGDKTTASHEFGHLIGWWNKAFHDIVDKAIMTPEIEGRMVKPTDITRSIGRIKFDKKVNFTELYKQRAN